MVWYSNLTYFVREAGLTLRQDRRLYATALLMISAAMTILGMFLLVVFNTHVMFQDLGTQLKILVFLADNLEAEQRQAIETHLHAFPGTQAVSYVSKEQARQDFIAWFAEAQEALAALPDNPLPASYVVHLLPQGQHDTSIESLIQQLSRLPGVEEVGFGARWFHGFRTAVQVLHVFSLASGLLLSTGVVVIIANTIRLTIHTRLDAIEIMQLVGATERFIKGPFLIHGMGQGFLGTLVALGLLGGLYQALVYQLGDTLPSIFGLPPLTFLPWSWQAGLLASGAFFGYIGSALTLSRVLRGLSRGHS